MMLTMIHGSIRSRYGVYLRAILFFSFSCLCYRSSFAQQWPILGNEDLVSSSTSAFTSVAVLDTVPYVAFREGASIGKVKRKNFSTNTWEQVGDNIGTNVTYTRIYVDKANNVVVIYVDASAGNRLAVKTYNPATQLWEPLNNDPNNLYVSTGSITNNVSQYGSTPRASMIFDINNTPYIAFADGANLTPFVKKFDGTGWVTIGSGAVDINAKAVGISLAIDASDILWLVYCSLSTATSSTGSMTVTSFVNGTWTPVVVPNPVPGGSATTGATASVRHTNIAINAAGNPVVAYFNTGNTNRATIITYNKATSTWAFSAVLAGRDSPNLGLVADNESNLYCSFNDYYASTNRFIARVFKQYAGTTTWQELKDPLATGVDEPINNIMLAIGTDTSKPFIVYTKTATSGTTTPVVRKFIPAGNPVVLVSNTVNSITTNSASAGGNIISDGGSLVTERGVVYGASVNPTIANSKVVDGSAGTGNFSVILNGLQPATFYYARAYATNGAGTSYGDNVRLHTLSLNDPIVTAPRQMEKLNRGVIAVRTSTSAVYVGWRLLGTDPANISFNVYKDGVKLNSTPVTNSTNYVDNAANTDGSYLVKTVINNIETETSGSTMPWATNQFNIPLDIPAGGTLPDGNTYTYTANDCSTGDIDGDGEYEIFLKWEPTRKNDNAGGYSGTTIIDCYKLNGSRLWRIDLGKNVNAGPHYTQFMVYDLDGDGKAEMACKTADGTIDGIGVVIGNPTIDYRNTGGWVQTGPEFLTVFNGLTGAAMATVNFEPARGNVSDWGDSYGNRCDRFVSAVAYLDGTRPSLIIGRGYYDKLVRAAYDYRGGQLTLRWIFDSKAAGTPANEAFSGQGNHQMTIGDVDGDGKDEVINGSSVIDDDGTRLWTYRNGHGDALHLSDMDPDRPGQELWQCLESPGSYSPYGLRLLDAKTGATIFGVATTGDVGRALAADIDPNHRGYEMWSSSGNLYNVQDGEISTSKPSNGSQAVNHAVWWDADLGRELLDGTIMDKWNPTTNSLNRLFTIYQAAPVSSNNDSKKNPALTADLFGDWREEIILRRSDNTGLIIFTTTIPTTYRIYTLMHDPQYRTAIAWQNSGYNQPPHPSFFLGYDMAPPPEANIYLAGNTTLPVKFTGIKAYQQAQQVQVEWEVASESSMQQYEVERSPDGLRFIKLGTVLAHNNGMDTKYSWPDMQPLTKDNYYRIKAIEPGGKTSYSKTVKVVISSDRNMIAYPTPLDGNTITLQLSNMPKGNYQVVLSNYSGQKIFTTTLTHFGGSMSQTIELPSLPGGMYLMEVSDGTVKKTATIVKRNL